MSLVPAGSEFLVLKPDNATGNFIKVPQRIGIRIAIDPGQRMLERLSPGMSVPARICRQKSQGSDGPRGWAFTPRRRFR
jgi:multidrug resistance efflux pump